jgi:MFS family permease
VESSVKTNAASIFLPQSLTICVQASAFFVAQVFTAPIYGAVSDRIGRKPVLLFGLVGSAVCTVVFGTASNIYVAIVSRVLCGVFNGKQALFPCSELKALYSESGQETPAYLERL